MEKCGFIVLTAAIFLVMGIKRMMAQDNEEIVSSEKTTQPITMVRYFEDYQFLSDPSKKIDFLDPIKYIPLSKKNKFWYLTIGGDVRFLYEYVNNRFGREENDDGYILSRYMMHTDWHLGKNVRIFGHMGSTWESGRKAGPRPVDEDQLFIHQFFADINFRMHKEVESTLRIGRQEVLLGSGRLVTIREGPNTRLSFDGFRWMNHWKGHSIQAFYLRPVNIQRGKLNNKIFEDDQSLWGVYSSWNVKAFSFVNFDTFFLGFNNDNARYHQGIGTEDRYIMGARFFGNKNNIDFNLEGGHQFGTFKEISTDIDGTVENDISSFGVSLDIGYTAEKLPLSPRFGLKTGYIRGDNNREDRNLNTSNTLYPAQAYFRGAAQFFPANFMDIHPELKLNLNKSAYIILDWTFYWRESLEDGIYLAGANPINPLENERARYLGSQANMEFSCPINRNFSVLATYSHFFTGQAIKDNPYPEEVADFINIVFSYKF